MGRMKEEWERDRQQAIALDAARAEAAYEALPKSLLESHEMIRSLQNQVATVVLRMNATGPKWTERFYGFGFGILASLVVAVPWPKLTTIFSIFK